MLPFLTSLWLCEGLEQPQQGVEAGPCHLSNAACCRCVSCSAKLWMMRGMNSGSHVRAQRCFTETEVRNRIIAKKRCRVQERRSLRSAWPWHRWHGLPGKLQFRSYNTRSRLENLELRHRAQRESERASSVDRSTSNSPAAARGERGSKRGREGSRKRSGTNTTDWAPATIHCHLHLVPGLAWRRRLRPLTMLETRRA